jgi:hypothetical protein
MVFRKGLIREDLQTSLILPARTETFEQLIVTARSYFQATEATSSNSSSQRIFAADGDGPCPYCLSETGRQFYHPLSKCRRKSGTGEYAQDSKKRSHDESSSQFSDVTCYRCNEKGHYANRCPSHSNSGRSGRGGRGRGRGRGGRGGSYYLWVPDEVSPQHAAAATSAKAIMPAPPPPGFVQPPSTDAHFFGGVIHHCLFTEIHRRPNRWIFDTGCTAHSSYLRTMFQTVRPCTETMFAANGAPMPISGIGHAGPFDHVLFLPDLRINLFSHKQAMRQGEGVKLSPNGQIFTVTLGSGRKLEFIFDSTFWIWDDDAAPQSSLALFPSCRDIPSTTGPQFTAPISHTGAEHEFLLLHFRVGHLNYTAMLRALGRASSTVSRTFTWSNFLDALSA